MVERYQKEPDVVTRVIGGETIIVPIKSAVINLGSIYTLNKVASRIWNLLDETPTIEEIIQTITREFRVTREEATKDVTEFLQQLSKSGLLVYKEPGIGSS